MNISPSHLLTEGRLLYGPAFQYRSHGQRDYRRQYDREEGRSGARWLPPLSKVLVKSKEQRHILSAGISLSAFPYSDFCRPRHHTRKQWLFANDCVSREKLRQSRSGTLCLWG
jgi:hypothetical protein